ncbi:MAG: hypothetical protein GY874_02650 [Desulfobacteraceae bacterium]|nr:hypothetical protein [Desulfobacteraceae bacterium]
MPLNIPSTAALVARNIANLETALNQHTPEHKKSFTRVLATMEALNYTGLYKFAAERALQNFAMTADGENLERIGSEFGVTRKAGEAAVAVISLPAASGVIIPAKTGFVGDSNGVQYFSDYAATAVDGAAIITVTAEIIGVAANLQPGDTLTISTQIAGAQTAANVQSIENTGADIEQIEVLRDRVLFRIRATLGGGNATDYKMWAEGVAGVQCAYPYAGKPFHSQQASYPGDRTIYVEATAAVHPDGIAPQALLDEVREAINADPVTGKTRPPLGLIDSTVYVESITRSKFAVQIAGLDVPADSVVEAKTDVKNFLKLYFLSVSPFVESIDVIAEKNNVLTDLTVSKIVQDVLCTYGGTAETANFCLEEGNFLNTCTLKQNEKAKLAGVSYV